MIAIKIDMGYTDGHIHTVLRKASSQSVSRSCAPSFCSILYLQELKSLIAGNFFIVSQWSFQHTRLSHKCKGERNPFTRIQKKIMRVWRGILEGAFQKRIGFTLERLTQKNKLSRNSENQWTGWFFEARCFDLHFLAAAAATTA